MSEDRDRRHCRRPSHLDPWPGQAERVEHLELLDRDRIALVDDPLAGVDGHLDRPAPRRGPGRWPAR